MAFFYVGRDFGGFKGKPKADQFYYIQLLTELNLLGISGGTNLSSSSKFNFFWEFEFVGSPHFARFLSF